VRNEFCSAAASGARLLVLGSAGLTEGFSLIGAEVYPDATPATVETVLAGLATSGAAALVLLEAHLAHAGGEWLNRLRNEGGSIVVTELPPLHAPEAYTPAVDAVVRAVLGPEALKAVTSDE
jgi:vacuolar-type H+-ATPase subunit F/Vma7